MKNLIKIKKILDEQNIDYSHLAYLPEVPLLGIDKSYVIEEMHGIKVMKLISCGDN